MPRVTTQLFDYAMGVRSGRLLAVSHYYLHFYFTFYDLVCCL